MIVYCGEALPRGERRANEHSVTVRYTPPGAVGPIVVTSLDVQSVVGYRFVRDFECRWREEIIWLRLWEKITVGRCVLEAEDIAERVLGNYGEEVEG